MILAFIRHRLTNYDELLATPRISREAARVMIRPLVEEILAEWGEKLKPSSPPGLERLLPDRVPQNFVPVGDEGPGEQSSNLEA